MSARPSCTMSPMRWVRSGVIVAGTLVILFDWTIADALITLGISGYILWHVLREIGDVIRILMLGTPPDLTPEAVLTALKDLRGVGDVHHLHIWQVDERQNALEAHLVMSDAGAVPAGEIKRSAKKMLAGTFAIEHATLEIEAEGEPCPDVAVDPRRQLRRIFVKIGTIRRHGRSIPRSPAPFCALTNVRSVAFIHSMRDQFRQQEAEGHCGLTSAAGSGCGPWALDDW